MKWWEKVVEHILKDHYGKETSVFKNVTDLIAKRFQRRLNLYNFRDAKASLLFHLLRDVEIFFKKDWRGAVKVKASHFEMRPIGLLYDPFSYDR